MHGPYSTVRYGVVLAGAGVELSAAPPFVRRTITLYMSRSGCQGMTSNLIPFESGLVGRVVLQSGLVCTIRWQQIPIDTGGTGALT